MRRRMVRGFAAVIALVGLAYATLPIWLPTGWIKRQLADQISADLDREVGIGRARLSWWDGVVFEDLTVAEQAGRENALLARVGQLRCALTPITTLLTGEVRDVEIVDPQLWLLFDERGMVLNLPALPQRRGTRLPAEQYVIRGAVCHILTPAANQSFRIDRLECRMHPAAAALQLSVSTVVTHSQLRPRLPSAGSISVQANLTVPQLRRDVKSDLQGTAHVEWTDLALTDLPAPIVSRLPVEQLDGVTGGRLSLTTHPNLCVDYDLFIRFNGVRIHVPKYDRPAQILDATLRCAGRFDPNIDELWLQDVSYETPAIRIHRLVGLDGAEPAIKLEKGGMEPLKCHLAGRVKDWQKLREEVPELDAVADRIDAELSGAAGFTLVMGRRDREDYVKLGIDGSESQWIVGGASSEYLHAEIGDRKAIEIEVTRNRKGGDAAALSCSLTAGELAAVVRAGLPLPQAPPAWNARWLLDALGRLASEVRIETKSVEKVLAMSPFVREAAGAGRWRGPLRMETLVVPSGDATKLDLAVWMDADTAIDVADWFAKEAGEPLTVRARTTIPHALTGELDALQIEAGHGRSRFALGHDSFDLQCRFQRLEQWDTDVSSVFLDASWTLPLAVNGIEDLISLCPRWQRHRADHPDHDLRGSMDLTLRGSVSYRPRNWIVQNSLEIGADRLAVRWDDVLHKSADLPMGIEVLHRWQGLGGRREQSVMAEVHSPVIELTAAATVETAGDGGPSTGFEQATINAQVHDLRGCLALMPAVSARLASMELDGSLSFSFAGTFIDDRHWLSLSANASEAAMTVPAGEERIRKAGGTDATLSLHIESDATDRRSGEQTWKITHTAGRFDGLNLADLSGRLIVQHEIAAAADDAVSMERRPALPKLKSASIEIAGSVDMDDSLASLHPELRRWIERFELSGTARGELGLNVDGRALAVNGRLDLTDAGLSVHTGDALVPAIHKLADVPVVLDIDATAVDWHGADRCEVEIGGFMLDVSGNTLSALGTVSLHRAPTGLTAVDRYALDVDLDIDNAGRVHALLPGAAIDPLAGRCAATMAVSRAGGRFCIEHGELELDDFKIGLDGDPLSIDGKATFDDTNIEPEQIRWEWGVSRGVASGYFTREDGQPRSFIGLAVDHVDVEDLGQRLDRFKKRLGGPEPSATSPASDMQAADVEARRRLITLLGGIEIAADVDCRTLRAVLPMKVEANAEMVAQHAAISEGQATLEFRCLIDGGVVTGELTSDLRAPDPTFHLEYTAEKLQPGPLVDKYLSLSFPGMKATGPLTIIDETTQKLLPAPGEPNPEIGEGELIIEGGSVEGRAAPLWMTRLLPGLNLAKFSFSYLHSWFKKGDDGRIRHQMIYQGNLYSIYMVGYSSPDRRFEYEVGVDFLANFNSRYWAESGQGRIPLFTKTGQVDEDGNLVNETVQYVPQEFVRSLIWNNNPVVTAYLAIRKQVLGKE